MTEPAPQPAVPDTVLMTLAGIAYGAPSHIAHYLSKAGPTAAEWQLAWLSVPPDPPVNFAFMAANSRTGDRVIAIRGTYPHPLSAAYWDDARQDYPFDDMVLWPCTTDARIACGVHKGLENLLKLTDAEGRTLETAISTVPADKTLTVTGHSLGGTLTPVLALRLAETFAGRPIEATSYAGLTPGNGAFAALFSPGTALGGKVRRVYNSLDLVPYGWDRVDETYDFYQPGPKGGPLVSALLHATVARLESGGYDYTGIGARVRLNGVLRRPVVPVEGVAYLCEMLHQHMPNTYLSLLGAPPLPFSILFGPMVVPRDHPNAADPLRPILSALYL